MPQAPLAVEHGGGIPGSSIFGWIVLNSSPYSSERAASNCMVWGKTLSKNAVIVHCDNQVVVDVFSWVPTATKPQLPSKQH